MLLATEQPAVFRFFCLLLLGMLIAVAVGCDDRGGSAGEGAGGEGHTTALGDATVKGNTTDGDPRTTSKAKTEGGSKDASGNAQEESGEKKVEESGSRPPDTLVGGRRTRRAGLSPNTGW